jgi:hypothetical protein
MSIIYPQIIEDQEAVSIVAQTLWACQADLTVLVGLPGPAAIAKVCALLNLWDTSNGTGGQVGADWSLT